MFGWLQKKFTATQLAEAESFLRSLKGVDDGVLDLISGTQMYWASFYQDKGKNLYEMESWLEPTSLFPAELSGNIRALQKQNSTTSVPGLMVWLFTSRGLVTPELKLVGRQLWEELVKASDNAEHIAFDFALAAGHKHLNFDRHRVPAGFEKLKR